MSAANNQILSLIRVWSYTLDQCFLGARVATRLCCDTVAKQSYTVKPLADAEEDLFEGPAGLLKLVFGP